jgi:hypothetical protein
MIGAEQIDILRRICLISETAWLMDELVHGDPLARVMVIGKAIAATARANPEVARIVAATNLMASLQEEAQTRVREKAAVSPDVMLIPRETLYPGPRQ